MSNFKKDMAFVDQPEFKDVFEALAYIQKHRLDDWVIVKVNDHYEIHHK